MSGRALLVTIGVVFAVLTFTATPAAATPFSPSSAWNTPLPAVQPVDQNNSWLKYGMSLQSHDGSFWAAYGPNVYTVTDGDPTVPVTCAKYCTNVPANFRVPATGIVGASGNDGWAAIIDPAAGLELDLWRATQDATGIHGDGGTAIDLTGDGWCQRDTHGHCYSATASGSALTAGLITPDDLRSGIIAHTLAITLFSTRSGLTACPATHTDGQGWLWDPPEGARLFLPRTFVIPSSWPAVARMVAKALQDYGAIVIDKGSWTLRFMQNGDWSGTDLANGPVHYPGDFPWSQLSVAPIAAC